MGLLRSCSMDSPWEVSTLEVKLEGDEGKCSYEFLGDEGIEGDMVVS